MQTSLVDQPMYSAIRSSSNSKLAAGRVSCRNAAVEIADTAHARSDATGILEEAFAEKKFGAEPQLILERADHRIADARKTSAASSVCIAVKSQLRPVPRCQGGLAPWQERRAKGMLRADLSGNVTLLDLAGACRMSCSQFSHAFRQTVGSPPHQWLLKQRVERAKDLILNSGLPLSQVALEAGFFDQSHLTRVFSRWVKTTPAAWRRARSGRTDGGASTSRVAA